MYEDANRKCPNIQNFDYVIFWWSRLHCDIISYFVNTFISSDKYYWILASDNVIILLRLLYNSYLQ